MRNRSLQVYKVSLVLQIFGIQLFLERKQFHKLIMIYERLHRKYKSYVPDYKKCQVKFQDCKVNFFANIKHKCTAV